MTSSLLDNELMQKYFGAAGKDDYERACCTAFNILQAMQEPIRKGDRYLFWHKDKVTEMVWEDFMATIEESHAEHLRLPDAFQNQEKFCCDLHQHVPGVTEYPCTMKKPTPSPEKCECSPACNHGYSEHCNCCGALDKPKDAVEEKIMEISMNHGACSGGWERELRDLVRLARDTK